MFGVHFSAKRGAEKRIGNQSKRNAAILRSGNVSLIHG